MSVPRLVRFENHDGVARITIDREAKRNALNDEVAGQIADGLRDAQADPEVRVIVLTGVGDKAFCAGGDLKAGANDSPFEVDPAHPRNPIIELFKTFEQTTKPTVARVNGHALAGGLGPDVRLRPRDRGREGHLRRARDGESASSP